MADEVQIKLDTKRLDQIIRRLNTDTDGFVRMMAQQVQTDAVTSFGSGPDGRTYTRRGITHSASAPGYPPNVDTGALRASVHVTPLKKNTYAVQDGVEYGVYLELGTPKMARRPWLYPAVFKMLQEFGQRFKGLFQ